MLISWMPLSAFAGDTGKAFFMPSCGLLLRNFYIGADGMVCPCMGMADCGYAKNYPNLFDSAIITIPETNAKLQTWWIARNSSPNNGRTSRDTGFCSANRNPLETKEQGRIPAADQA